MYYSNGKNIIECLTLTTVEKRLVEITNKKRDGWEEDGWTKIIQRD